MKFKILFICLFLISCSHEATRQPTQIESSKIKISFVGDILVHKALYESVMRSPDKKFSRLWTAALPYFESADYSYGNLEGPTALGINNQRVDKGDIGFVYDGMVYSGTGFSFNYHPNIIDDIKASGFDIVSTSNNHTKDRGIIGVDKTIDAMNLKGFNFVGTRKKGDTNPASFYRITEIKNFRVGWVSCTEHLNGNDDKAHQVLYCVEESSQIVALIQELKNTQKVDVVIVTPHWGEEYQPQPTATQKKQARLFLDAGADVIMGSHPHVLQPVEQYRTTDGRETFIAYSLGNFVSGQARLERKASAIIFLEFEKNQNGTRISNYTYQPTSFLSEAEKKNPQPHMILATGMPDSLKHIETFLSRKLIPLTK